MIKFDFYKWVKKSGGEEKTKFQNIVVDILQYNTTDVDFYMLTTLFITG
ncbi:hypothetical protein [Ferruginibacter sp.]